MNSLSKVNKSLPVKSGSLLELLQAKGILQPQIIILVSFIVMCAVFSILKPVFLSPQNIINIGRQIPIIAITAFGMTFVILAGEIDLSVGAVVGLAGMVATLTMAAGYGAFLAVLAALVLGIVVGLVNGLMTTKLRLPSFLATLATMSIIRGLSLASTPGAASVTITDESFVNFFATGSLGPVPAPVIFIALTLLTSYVLLSQTVFGKHIYAAGGSAIAANLAGVRVNKVKIMTFVISGIMAATAGLILASRLSAGVPQAGDGQELDAIAAVVLGGTKFSGGSGTVIGTLVGALIIGVLANGLTLLGLPYAWKLVVKGAIIAAAIIFDVWVRKE